MSHRDQQRSDDSSREDRSPFRMKLFGPSRALVWEALSREVQGRIEQGGFWRGTDKFIVEVANWTIVLDTYNVHTGEANVAYTRMRAPYVNADGFRFCVFRKHFFSGIATWMGLQDVQVGFPEFDEAFIIRGDSEPKLRLLFANHRIRELIESQPQIRFEVKDDEGTFRHRFPEGVDMLQYLVAGQIKDVERLKRLYELFAETLHHLCHMGSAYEDDPNVTLK